MRLHCDAGWLREAERKASPNYSPRPPEAAIDMIVIHGISLPPGEFGGDGIDALFNNQLDPSAHPYYATIAHLQVSTHLVIDRQGQIKQYVNFQNSAWHAGPSSWLGRGPCNPYSIGIELEGADTVPYRPIQYDRLVAVVRFLMCQYPGIQPGSVVRHSDIAPGRKTDPGHAFGWATFRARLLVGI